MAKEFQEQLIEFLPKMRVWALALTRNRAAADDLTQDVATKALVAQDCFIPGTNFSAWVHRIMINHFISSVRSKREFTDMENMPEVAVCRRLMRTGPRCANLDGRWSVYRLISAKRCS